MHSKKLIYNTINCGIVSIGCYLSPTVLNAALIFEENFSDFALGAFPNSNQNWLETENPNRSFITDFEDVRGLTFSTPANERTSLERAFTIPENANEVIFSVSVRFPTANAGNEGLNNQFVPTVRIWGDEMATGDIGLGFQSWGRIRVFTLGPNGAPTDFNLDSNRIDGVDVYTGSNRFGEFVNLTVTYDKITGRTTLDATSDTASAAWLDYSVEWDAFPGMTFDTYRISSASSQAANRGHSENYSQIGSVAVAIPEPSTYAMISGILVIGLLAVRRYRFKK